MSNLLSDTMTDFTAGEDFCAGVSFDSYAASDGYSLTYYMRGPKSHSFQASGAATGDSYTLTASADTTANLPGGTYDYVGMISDTATGLRREVDSGRLIVYRSPLYTSFAESRVSAINAVVEDRASTSQLTTQIDGIQLRHLSVDDLITWRDYFSREVQRERRAEAQRRGRQPNTVRTRFL